jgi:hypothetical protein
VQPGDTVPYNVPFGSSGTAANNVPGTWQCMGRDNSGASIPCQPNGFGYTLWVRTV